MQRRTDIPVIYENGVFRPESPVDLPERSRHHISIHDDSSPANGHPRASLKDSLEQLRARGLIRTGGWRPTRDELHERG